MVRDKDEKKMQEATCILLQQTRSTTTSPFNSFSFKCLQSSFSAPNCRVLSYSSDCSTFFSVK